MQEVSFISLFGGFSRTNGKILSVKDPNGNDISSATKVSTSFTFTRREWDKEADLYYYRARYYDPQIGRFLQQDPDPGDLGTPISAINRYVYAASSPINITDPTGASWLSDFAYSPGKALGNLLSSKDFQIAAIVVAAVFTGGAAGLAAGVWTSTAIGGTSGVIIAGFTAGIAGAIVGAQVGAAVGAISGGLGASLSGRDISQGINSGANLGYDVGAVAGGLAGIGTYAWGGNPYGFIGKFVQNHVTEFLITGSLLPTILSQIAKKSD